MRQHLTRHLAGYLLVALALGCTVVARARLPAHGLQRTLFTDATFTQPAADPVRDMRVHLSTDDAHHRPGRWLGEQAAVRWEGFLEAPREGDYIFRLLSDDGAVLFVDGRRLIDNGGAHPPRALDAELFLTKGSHAIRIDYTQLGGGAAMKLEWRLPSGYNSLGLVPVSMLHPQPVTPPGAMDRIFRVLPWILALAAIAAFRREQLLRWRQRLATDVEARRQVQLALGLFAGALLVRLVGLNGAGETCDEWAYVGAGRLYAENLAYGIFDADQWSANREHPAVGKLIYGAAQFVFGDAPTVSRVASAVLNSATVVIAALSAWRLFGGAAALGAGVILALLPSFVAHGQIAALDVPAAFFFTGAMALFLRILTEPGPRNRGFLLLGLVLGLGIATKFSNGLAAIFVFVTWVLLTARESLRTGEVRLPLGLALSPVVAALPIVALWPWLWASTGDHFRETLGHWNYLPPETFLGRDFIHAPVHYYLVAFAFVTPVLLALPFLWAIVASLRQRSQLVRAPAEGALLSRGAALVYLWAWFLLPFAWSFAQVRQDGIRYVYAAFPPFAILLGMGLAQLAQLSTRLQPRLVPALAAVVALYLGGSLARVHPYYLDYFNEAVGGASGVYRGRLLETGWWGEGIDRTVDWLNQHAPQHATWSFRGLVTHTTVGLREDLHRRDRMPDFLIFTDFRPDNERVPGYEEAFTVRVDGVPIAGVFRRQGVAQTR